MKKILLPVCMLLAFNAFAHIEDDGKNDVPSPQEIAKNRACFEEVARNGCGDPGEDHKHFRSCLHNIFSNLDSDCQKMMANLYGKRK